VDRKASAVTAAVPGKGYCSGALVGMSVRAVTKSRTHTSRSADRASKLVEAVGEGVVG